MNPTLKAKIDRIYAAFGEWWGRPPIPPATEVDVARVREWFGEHHHATMPQDLEDFWLVTNGIGLDGCALWAAVRRERSSGVIDVNELYIEEFADQFFLGKQDDITMYSYHPASGKFRELVMFDLDTVCAEYDTFDDLAEKVLTDAMMRAGLL